MSSHQTGELRADVHGLWAMDQQLRGVETDTSESLRGVDASDPPASARDQRRPEHVQGQGSAPLPTTPASANSTSDEQAGGPPLELAVIREQTPVNGLGLGLGQGLGLGPELGPSTTVTIDPSLARLQATRTPIVPNRTLNPVDQQDRLMGGRSRSNSNGTTDGAAVNRRPPPTTTTSSRVPRYFPLTTTATQGHTPPDAGFVPANVDSSSVTTTTNRSLGASGAAADAAAISAATWSSNPALRFLKQKKSVVPDTVRFSPNRINHLLRQQEAGTTSSLLSATVTATRTSPTTSPAGAAQLTRLSTAQQQALDAAVATAVSGAMGSSSSSSSSDPVVQTTVVTTTATSDWSPDMVEAFYDYIKLMNVEASIMARWGWWKSAGAKLVHFLMALPPILLALQQISTLDPRLLSWLQPLVAFLGLFAFAILHTMNLTEDALNEVTGSLILERQARDAQWEMLKPAQKRRPPDAYFMELQDRRDNIKKKRLTWMLQTMSSSSAPSSGSGHTSDSSGSVGGGGGGGGGAPSQAPATTTTTTNTYPLTGSAIAPRGANMG